MTEEVKILISEIEKRRPTKWLEQDKSVSLIYSMDDLTLSVIKGKKRLYRHVKDNQGTYSFISIYEDNND